MSVSRHFKSILANPDPFNLREAGVVILLSGPEHLQRYTTRPTRLPRRLGQAPTPYVQRGGEIPHPPNNGERLEAEAHSD
jgi:hypothetical protein